MMRSEMTVPEKHVFRFVPDTLVMLRRNLLRYLRIPQLLVFSTIQPIVFVLLFAYVFGGAIGGSLLGAFLLALLGGGAQILLSRKRRIPPNGGPS